MSQHIDEEITSNMYVGGNKLHIKKEKSFNE